MKNPYVTAFKKKFVVGSAVDILFMTVTVVAVTHIEFAVHEKNKGREAAMPVAFLKGT